MSSANKRLDDPARLVRELARAVADVGRRAAQVDRVEETRLRSVAARLEERRLMSLESDTPGLAISGDQTPIWEPRRALLIINSKSGPKRDSLMRARELVDMLAAYNISADVRVKLSKSQARKDARAAAESGYALVIAAGGDGTVEAVARGLIGTDAALGILPLGTYNNIAYCFGIPTDLSAACALLANYSPRPIDVGYVQATGMSKPRVFMELATVGLGAVLTPVGQDIEKGRLADAMRKVPHVVNLEPTGVLMRLDGSPSPWWGHALLLTVSNMPRSGAALNLAPEARVDDGLLDLVLYDGLNKADLASRIVALKTGDIANDGRVRQARALSIEVHTEEPMAVGADSKLVGTTPARFTIEPGALLAVVGRGPGLTRPASGAFPLPLLQAGTPPPPPADKQNGKAAPNLRAPKFRLAPLRALAQRVETRWRG